jgi:hypothetical protein
MQYKNKLVDALCQLKVVMNSINENQVSYPLWHTTEDHTLSETGKVPICKVSASVWALLMAGTLCGEVG